MGGHIPVMFHGSPLGVIPVVFHGSPCLPAVKRKECRFSDAQNRVAWIDSILGKVQPVDAWKKGLKSDDDLEIHCSNKADGAFWPSIIRCFSNESIIVHRIIYALFKMVRSGPVLFGTQDELAGLLEIVHSCS